LTAQTAMSIASNILSRAERERQEKDRLEAERQRNIDGILAALEHRQISRTEAKAALLKVWLGQPLTEAPKAQGEAVATK